MNARVIVGQRGSQKVADESLHFTTQYRKTQSDLFQSDFECLPVYVLFFFYLLTCDLKSKNKGALLFT